MYEGTQKIFQVIIGNYSRGGHNIGEIGGESSGGTDQNF